MFDIEPLYLAFSEVPRPTAVVGCACCSDPEQVATLTRVPLRELTPAQLLQYSYSAVYTVGTVDDFRYFLPRLVEVCIHEDGSGPSIVSVLDRVRYSKWDNWPQREQDGLLELGHLVGRWFADERIESDVVDDWIVGLAQLQEDVTPYLGPLLSDTPAAMANLIGLFEWLERDIKRGRVDGPYWEERPAPAASFLAWLRSPAFDEALSRAYGSGAG